jgi:hypothetical protein
MRLPWQEAERAYVLWKARRRVEQQGAGAVAVKGAASNKRGAAEEPSQDKALLDFAVNRLKADLFPGLMDMMR